jgi:hypothetical protein
LAKTAPTAAGAQGTLPLGAVPPIAALLRAGYIRDLPVGGDELTIHESAVVGPTTDESTSVIPGGNAERSRVASPVAAAALILVGSLALLAGDWQARTRRSQSWVGGRYLGEPHCVTGPAASMTEQDLVVSASLSGPPPDRVDIRPARLCAELIADLVASIA